jgi:hypothetical protein
MLRRAPASLDRYLNLNSAVCSVPSTSSTCSWRHVPAQLLSVFHT